MVSKRSALVFDSKINHCLFKPSNKNVLERLKQKNKLNQEERAKVIQDIALQTCTEYRLQETPNAFALLRVTLDSVKGYTK